MGQLMSALADTVKESQGGKLERSNYGKAHTMDLLPISQHIPEEVLVHILSYVDPRTLLKLRLCCKLWKQLIDKEVWKLKASRERYSSLHSVNPKQKLPWYLYHFICVKDLFGKNLVKNHCGQG